MTTIAYDGTTLAADKQATANGVAYTVTKIHRNGRFRMAYTGTAVQGVRMVEWFTAGADPGSFPTSEDSATLVVIDGAGRILEYQDGPTPLHIEDTQCAWGSGGDFARAAMHLGKTAWEAVEVASALDLGTGRGVDTLEPTRTKK